ncbi:WYL domain-containing protein [Kitasatospora nipponensis]|uniref:WYL domain-containing protein n=1 Tax=Kitasatospora nipponensis TaxID=258049 RepID=A0ABP4G7N5_9ACTN
MLETSARLLRLLALLQVRREWSGADLAERLQVDVRTVRRDMEKLRTLGYPVDSTPGAAGGYRLAAGAEMPPLLLDDEEAVAVALGLRTAANGTVAGIEETSVRALAKLQQVMPARLRSRVESLAGATVEMRSHGPRVDADVLSTIAAACRSTERLRFEYRTREGSSERRDVEPYRLVHSGARWYLVAFDTVRQDWRNFRVDRLELRPPHGPRFAPRPLPAQDVRDFVSWEVAIGQYRYQARFTVRAPAAVVRERIAPTSGLVTPLDENSCTLRAGSNSLDGLAVHIGVLDLPFTVHEPPELVERIALLARRLHEATSPAEALEQRAGRPDDEAAGPTGRAF